MKRLFRIWRAYALLSWALLGLIAALVLTFLRHATAAHWVLAAVSLVAVLPLVRRMWQDIRSGSYGVDILAATAIVTSVMLRQDWAAIVIVIMLAGGDALEEYANRRAQRELRDLLKRAPQQAHLVRGRKVLDVAASAVRVHDKCIIKPGEVVPVDAVIVNGTGNFDESSLTGESLPQTRRPGDQVLSGSLSLDTATTVRALRTAKDSQYQQIISLVRGAAAHPAHFVRLADRYSIPFTIVAYTIAGLAWILSHQAIRFLEVIVVATPCPLLLAAPIAFIAGMSRAAREGIVIKTGTALEQLARIRTMAFDKTGTLTVGLPSVDQVVAFSPYSRRDILTAAASMEQSSNHILAKAVVAAAASQHYRLRSVHHVQETAGSGLSAKLGGDMARLGRLEFLQEQGVQLPKQQQLPATAQTATYLAIGGRLAGYITFRDELRPEAKSTIRQLKQLGVLHTLMITGDRRAVAKAIARQLGMTDIVAEALPVDKLRTLETVPNRPAAFVGDGVNDAPVLMSADVGIALGARGSTAASESADAVIMRDDLACVPQAVAIARRSVHIATQSIVIGIVLSVILMIIFASGAFPPLYGAIVQEAVDVFVIFNALRAHFAVPLNGA